MTNNKFSYAYFYQKYENYFYDDDSDIIIFNDSYIILIIFELYGNNYNNLLVRYYKVNLLLKQIVYIKDLKPFYFNSFLGLGFCASYIDSKQSEGMFIILGYPNKEFNEEITEISLDISLNNKGFIINNNIILDNNLFGYELGMKANFNIDGAKIFSIKENRQIEIDEVIYDDSIFFDFLNVSIQIDDEYIIDITSMITTPEYDKFISLYEKKDEYGEDYNNSKYYTRRIIKEKIFKFKLNCFNL